LITLLKTPKLFATVTMAVGPALSLARRRAIPRKTACLALEQDGKIGFFGSFATAVAKVPTEGEQEWRHVTTIINTIDTRKGSVE